MRNVLLFAAAAAAISFVFGLVGHSLYVQLQHGSESAEVTEGLREMSK